MTRNVNISVFCQSGRLRGKRAVCRSVIMKISSDILTESVLRPKGIAPTLTNSSCVEFNPRFKLEPSRFVLFLSPSCQTQAPFVISHGISFPPPSFCRSTAYLWPACSHCDKDCFYEASYAAWCNILHIFSAHCLIPAFSSQRAAVLAVIYYSQLHLLSPFGSHFLIKTFKNTGPPAGLVPR